MKSNPRLTKSQELQNDIRILCETINLKNGISNVIFQINKSSTSIHANIKEANYPQSLPDMLSKLQIAKKEFFETEGWLQYLFDNIIIDDKLFKILAIRRALSDVC
jgi:four helix bundle protein